MKQSIFTILSNTPLTDSVYKMVLSGDTSAIHDNLAFEEVGGNSHGTSGNCVCNFCLQALCKAVVALAGDNR